MLGDAAMTWKDLILESLAELGIVSVGDEPPADEQMARAMERLRGLLDAWMAQGIVENLAVENLALKDRIDLSPSDRRAVMLNLAMELAPSMRGEGNLASVTKDLAKEAKGSLLHRKVIEKIDAS